MKALSSKRGIPLEVILPDPVFFLNEVAPRRNYVDGKVTDDIVGYTYVATNTGSFDQISVFIEQETPLITEEELLSLHEAGEKIFVEFKDAVLKPYYNERLKTIQDSIRATSIHQVATD